MEYQLRFWGMFRWLSGDHLVEQAAHEIDIANWVVGDHPVTANGMGGREVRKGPGCGDIWDHHCVEFEYANGVRYYCQARQQPGTWSYVGDHVHGTTALATLGTGAWGLGEVGPREIRAKTYRGDNPYQREHDDLMASIRGSGPYCFEGSYGADSSMTAVMGRMATYSGQSLTWQQAIQSEVRWAPKSYALDADPPNLADADGAYTAALPGVFKF
jgi:myo-inositol 2-dehydrogenase / D-chiro-inositol 1-dehydrogenase